MVWTTLLTLAAAALGVDADLDGDGGDAGNAPASHTPNHTSGGDVHFGADEKPASELIISANGLGYPTPSDYVAGTNPYAPK